MSVELKIKAKHLALEPAIIKKEERKLQGQIKWNNLHQKPSGAEQYKRDRLYLHRTRNVRFEARATHLARAYLANKRYSEVEASRKPEKEDDFRMRVVTRVNAMVKRYGDSTTVIGDILNWLES